MEILIADHLGFCYGVKRAISTAKEYADGKSFTLGPIIHNPQVVARLKAEGVNVAESLSEVKGGTVIIRSHGVGPKIYEEAEAKGLNIVDATCPFVKKAQNSARKLLEEGYQVVVIGEKDHPEVRSIFEWTDNQAVIIETEEEAEQFSSCQKLGIVSQTTVSADTFKGIVSKLLDKSNEIKILRTICTATEQRQSAAIKLSNEVDLMIVIGGRNSANTTRLAQLCKQKCKTIHIETAEEISPEEIKEIKKIGITAGASTPDWIIREVQEKCQTILRE